ncbi:protein of unknown function [Rhodovastum atsumiense]|nr:protein of unknown function [Rhodovastum atsumiense]
MFSRPCECHPGHARPLQTPKDPRLLPLWIRPGTGPITLIDLYFVLNQSLARRLSVAGQGREGQGARNSPSPTRVSPMVSLRLVGQPVQ